jgi:ribosome-binding protein aMBF1 (putative translation factor)
MAKKEKTRDAVSILHGRYVKDDPERRAALQEERINAEVARLIHDMRTDAGLSQQQLAELIGTTQSVVSRLEDSDYEGRSLTVLDRIARALNQKLTVVMTAREPEPEDVREAFPRVVQMLRRSRGLTIGMLSEKTNIDKAELTALERAPAYRPTPLTLHRLSQFFDIPHRKLAVLAGAIKEVSEGFRERAIQFAAQSDSFSKLTKEEQKILDDFVNLLREDK